MRAAVFVLCCMVSVALGDATVGEQVRATQGVIVSGTVSGPNIASPSQSAEFHGNDDALIGVVRNGPANATGEGAYIWWAKDANGTMRKLASISALTPVYGAQDLYSVVRYNASYTVNGVGHDDLSIQQHGGRGVTLCGVGGNDTPAAGVGLMVRCNAWLIGSVQLEQPLGLADGLGEPDCKPGIAQFYVGTDHKPKIKMGNCTVYTLVTQ